MKKFIAYLLLLFIVPMAMEAKKKEFAPGLYWEVVNNNILVISGQGEFPSLKKDKYPWRKKSICTQIRKIVIDEGVTSIGNNAFDFFEYNNECCTNLEVFLPSSLERIGGSAFAGTHIESIDIPSSVKVINSWAFYRTDLRNVVWPSSVKIIPESCFYDCYKLEHVTIPRGVTRIGEDAFKSCNLSRIIIPESVKVIEREAFSACRNLTYLYICDGVERIGESTFGWCEKLSDVRLPSNTVCGEHVLGTNRYTQGYYQLCRANFYNLPQYITETNCESYGIERHHFDYFKKGRTGIVDSNGEIILKAKERQYLIDFGSIDNNKKLYLVKDYDVDGEGVVKEDGNWFIPLTKGRRISRHDTPLYYEISDNEILSRMDANGKWIITPDKGCRSIKEMEINSKTYYLVSKAKYSGPYGLLSATGNQIFPCEYEQLSHAGGQFLKFKIGSYYGIMKLNGDVVIPTSRGYTSIGNYVSSQNVFAYTANGYKGEVDGNGVEKSRIKVAATTTSSSSGKTNSTTSSSSSTTTTSSSSSTSNTQSGTSTQQTIIVEHKHDPQPMQVWHQCGVCYGSGMCRSGCNGTGWFTGYSGNSTLCIGCGGSGRCQFCAGQGGHYEVEYR